MNNFSIGFIGSGNMASAIIKGIIASNIICADKIFTYDVNIKARDELCRISGVNAANSNAEIARLCDFVVLAVKPAFIDNAINDILHELNSEHTLISIAAGITTAYLREKTANKCKIIRVMPNTPALVQEGMTAVCKYDDIDNEKMEFVGNIFKACGRVEYVDEKYMDAITAISGSSPAYIFMLIEAMADGGVLMGLPRDLCYKVISQAVLGSAKMLQSTEKHPGQLKDIVCSPGGTTIEAIRVLENHGFRSALIEAVKACTEKSKSLGNDK